MVDLSSFPPTKLMFQFVNSQKQKCCPLLADERTLQPLIYYSISLRVLFDWYHNSSYRPYLYVISDNGWKH